LSHPRCETIEAAYIAIENCGIPLDALEFQEQSDCRICMGEDDYGYYDYEGDYDEHYEYDMESYGSEHPPSSTPS
jgi:hypothetical protein